MQTGTSPYNRQGEMMMAINSFYDITHPLKRALLYLLVFVSVTVFFSWVFMRDLNQVISPGLKNTIFISAFILTGTVHVFTSKKMLPHLYKRPGKQSIVFTLLLTSVHGLVAYLSFLLMAYHNALLALSASAAFLLPSLVEFGWLYFNALVSATPSTFETWVIPEITAAPAGRKVAAFLTNLPVKIKLKKAYYDIKEMTFTEAVAPRLTLGKMFSEFLKEKSTAQPGFDLTDERLQPYGWQFFSQQLLESIPLNPNATLIENNVQPGDTISAERIKKS